MGQLSPALSLRSLTPSCLQYPVTCVQVKSGGHCLCCCGAHMLHRICQARGSTSQALVMAGGHWCQGAHHGPQLRPRPEEGPIHQDCAAHSAVHGPAPGGCGGRALRYDLCALDPVLMTASFRSQPGQKEAAGHLQTQCLHLPAVDAHSVGWSPAGASLRDWFCMFGSRKLVGWSTA